MKKLSWRTRIFCLLGISGSLTIVVGFAIRASAQTLGGTMTAAGAGAALGAAAGAGVPTAGQATRGVGNNRQAEQNALIDEAGNNGANAGGGAGGGGAQVTVRVETQRANRWGNNSGDQMVNQLMSRRPAPGARARTSQRQAARATRMARLSPRQRTSIVHSKYRKPPVGYLSWYLPEDRYKVTSKVWNFVTTPNDRFYYQPWAPAMRLRNPARVIGFHTWQDAMIAGYRPDPATRPSPAPQLAFFAGLTRGPNLSRYFEFVYGGHVRPETLDEHYRYVRYVAGEVRRHSHTRSLVTPTVEQVLGAFTGVGTFPSSVGGTPALTTETETQTAPAAVVPAGGAPAGLQAGNTDRREGEYNTFRNNAGGLAARPGG